MAEAHHDAHPQSVQVEQWEIEVAKSVTRSFKTFPEYEDLEAELFKRLLELKGKKRPDIVDWRGFLARSLYNAATDLVRHWSFRNRKVTSLATPVSEDDLPATLEDLLAAPDDLIDLRIELAGLLDELTPELRELWHLLVEECGNKSALAKRLGRPRKTIEHWIGKIRSALERRGFGRPKK